MTKIFVFGSNLLGRHGMGAALFAANNRGAKYGVGIGRTGNSYAIPTKGLRMEVLPLDIISEHVKQFIDYVIANPQLEFELTRVGCGLAGYKDHQIAPLFKGIPRKNVKIAESWKDYL